MHVAIASALLAAAGSEPNPIVPNLSEFIVGGLAFLLLFFILQRTAYPRMNQALKERTSNIEGKLEKAEQERQEAEKLLRQYRDKLASAEEETQRIIEQARADAERVRRDLRSKAEAEAEREIERARQAIRQERNQAVQELRREVGTLAVELATRVVGDSLDRERQLRLVDEYIADLDRQASAEASAAALTSRPEGGDGGPR
jgi:F-type H+-transporting ATPase subunit b